MRKELVGFLHSVVGKKRFLVQFEGGQRREMDSCSLVCVCSKQQVCLDMDETISDFPEKEQGEFLTIDGDPGF